MIVGMGTDIVEVARLARSLEKGDAFVKLVFSAQEIAYCAPKKYAAMHFAGRFAAKEAFLKALGTGWRGEIALHEISIENNPEGKPEIQISGATAAKLSEMGQPEIWVSISHTEDYATAVVILEKRDI